MQAEQALLEALAVAERYAGCCAPNPAVGAVLVCGNQIVAVGVHKGCGTLHAERDLLTRFTDVSESMVLYVTLEPCSHHGRTPPCTDIILASSIKKVVFAHKDPNPNVSGDGQSVLRAAGVDCEQVVVPEIEAFYRAYDCWSLNKMPYVTAKLALSRDEKIAGPKGERRQLTGALAGHFTHRLRKRHDAILTTITTIQNDDPKLNVRLGGELQQRPVYLLDSQAQLAADAQILQTASAVTVLHAPSAEFSPLAGVCYQSIPVCHSGLDWQAVLRFVGEQGVQALWVEAGARCFASLYQSDWLAEMYLYQAPIELGEEALPAFVSPLCLQALLTDKHFSCTKETLGEDTVWHLLKRP